MTIKRFLMPIGNGSVKWVLDIYGSHKMAFLNRAASTEPDRIPITKAPPIPSPPRVVA